MKRVKILEERWRDNNYRILHLNADENKLVLEGIEGGDSVEEMFGDFDYEYWVSIESRQYPDLLVTLIKELFDRKIFMKASDFQEFCEKHGMAPVFRSQI